MATTQVRPSRKRKADEAEIESRGPGELKRLKLDTNPESISAQQQIKNPSASPDDVPVPDAASSSSSNSPTTNAAAPDPFAAFADYSASSNPKETSTDLQHPKVADSASAEEKQTDSNELCSTGWPDMASNGGGFGSFADDSAPASNVNGGGWGQATEFKFGADDADFDLTKIVTSPPTAKVAELTDEAIAQLTGVVDSGDGADETVHSLACTVYELDAEVNRYKEKGVGEVRLNTYTVEEKVNARLLCRQLLTFRTLINCALQSDTQFTKVNERNVRFTVFEQLLKEATKDKTEEEDKADKEQAKEKEAEAVAVTKTYLLKLKEAGKGKIDEFIAKITEIQSKM